MSEIEKILQAADGKITLSKTNIKSLRTKTLKLICGVNTGYLALDVDEYDNKYNEILLNYLKEKNNLIIHSDKYTIDDVFNGKCRYKVIFKYNGANIVNKKENKHIEVFYTKTGKSVCIWGKKNDYEKYKYQGKAQDLYFDINEILKVKVPFNLFGNDIKIKNKKETIKKPKKEVKKGLIDFQDDGYKEVTDKDIKNLQKILTVLKYDNVPKMEISKGKWIVFKCIFPELHKRGGNHAFAFKIGNKYVVNCQGEVCSKEYSILNREIVKYLVSFIKYDNFLTFDKIDHSKLNIFKAPTGWGKTERIAGEALNAINNDERLLILMPDKTSIERLCQRINEFSKGHFSLLKENNKIVIYTSDHRPSDYELDNANVIISHHYYFINAGQLLTYYPRSWNLLEFDGLKLIVDEAHTLIEKITRLDIKIGSMYENSTFNLSNVMRMSHKKLTREEAKNNNCKILTSVLNIDDDKFNNFNFNLSYRKYESVNYFDLYKIVNERLKLVNEWKEDNMLFKSFINENVTNIRINDFKTTDDYNAIIDELVLGSCDTALVSINVGDDLKRKKIGEVILTIFHSQLLKKLLSIKSVILTTATFENYHYNIIKKIKKENEINKIVIDEKIEKVKQIRLLWTSEKKQIRDYLIKELDDYNIKSLIFLQTIKSAKQLLHKYSHILLNDNGIYSFGERKNVNDYGDNIERNITVAGLESSVAKGYNYIEEIEGSDGFEVLYFDGVPISPTRIKKYVNENGECIDTSVDYNASTLAQAIGRVFRKQKNALTICLRGFPESKYKMILKYLRDNTTSEIIEGDLNITNFKISISKFESLNILKGNSFIEKLKGKGN